MAVSIKMNILLFAPALFFAYIFTQGYFGTLKQLAICASFQLIVALPFLYENPISYMKGSFDLGRVFLHKWTVNWRFVPECLFVHTGMYGFHGILIHKHIFLFFISRISFEFTCFTFFATDVFISTMGSVVKCIRKVERKCHETF